jgi:HD-GYP domain-containing protein (c-di-GMP phosphodiesterase class II)
VTTRPSSGDFAAVTEAAGESYLRRAGRQLTFAMYGALRAVKLYPVENAAVQKALSDLASQSREIASREGELDIRMSGEFIFVNHTRLRLELENFASFSHLLSVFRAAGIGTLVVSAAAQPKDWLVLLSLLQSGAPTDDPESRLVELQANIESVGITVFAIGAPPEASETLEQSKERAKRTYAQSVVATRELMTSLRMGASPAVKKIKRVVQSIVDQILTEETSLIGLTTLRDYDEYTFTHSVNVCIFAVALGKRLGLTRVQLYDLGIAALLHDIGKSRVPQDILNKPDGLSEEEWQVMAGHPWMGVLSLFNVRGAQELPYRAMIVAFEHHMKRDLTGYPRVVRPRELSLFSRIVATADGFDAATSRRAYQTVPLSPADVLREMRDNPRRGMDPIVVKAFINLTGIYPVGTLVILDTFELAVVHAPNPVADMLSRPIVRIISDAMGNLLHPGNLFDLAEVNEAGAFLRTIIKTEDPDRYGIRIGDYFV